VNHRLFGIFRAVEYVPGGKYARTYHHARLDHLRLRKDHLRRGGRIVRRRDAVSKVRVVRPLLLGVDVERVVAHVSVNVYKAGHDGFAGHIYLARGGRNTNVSADGLYSIVFDEDAAFLDHLIALHGDDTGVGKRYEAARFCRLELKSYFCRSGFRSLFVFCKLLEYIIESLFIKVLAKR